MSSYDDPKPQHRNALKQIAEARDRALTAVSQVRQRTLRGPDEHLTPAQGEEGEPTFQARMNQEVVNYLMNLRPYRGTSEKWDIDFGTVELPKEIPGGSKPGRKRGEKPNYRICQSPEVALPTASRLIAAVNTDILYSTARPRSSRDEESKIPAGWAELRHDGQRYMVPEKRAQAHLNGETPFDELLSWANPVPEDTKEEPDEFQPSSPFRGDTRQFKFAFGADELLAIVEVADEVAEEMDMLAEIEQPDRAAGGGDAV